jgi:superoxide dismutase, Cu-Zn family
MMHSLRRGLIAVSAGFGLTVMAAGVTMAAGDLTVTMQKATPTGPGETLGTVVIAASPAGAVFTLKLHGLPPGPHGFHIHQNRDCEPVMLNGVRIPAGAAGGHWDPGQADKHEGPMGHGHMGDLPLLQVANDGTATQTLTAPHIMDIGELKGRALMIHVGGDNYSDEPTTLGGGGLRLACGSIQ